MADSSRTLVAALVRTEMWTKTTAGCVIVVLAAVLVAVWRRRRWRRARPWLAKLRAETASKIEKERTSDKETCSRPMSKDTVPKEFSDKEKKPKADSGSLKRSKDRRRRGKDPKPTRTSAAPQVPATQPSSDSQLTPPIQSSPEPHLIPLPPSPIMSPTLVLSDTVSPASTEIPTTTPPASTPVSIIKTKLPAFPPASPLPPNLARKPPPVVRRPIPSLTSIDTNTGSLRRKPSYTADRKGSKEGEGAEGVEFPSLNSFLKEERPKAGRKDRARKPSDVHKKTATPESTQIASLKGALEAARLREEEVAGERRAWHKKEQELQTQVNQLSHQLHALTIAFATGGGQGFPPYSYGYGAAGDSTQPTTPVMKCETGSETELGTPAHTPGGHAYPAMYIPYPQLPIFMAPHGPPMAPMPSPTPTMSPPPMSPQAPSYLFSQNPWSMYRGGSPMHHGHPMSPPGGIPMGHGAPGIPGRYSTFYSGSPRRDGSRPPRRHGTGTPSTPSVGSVEDSIPLPGVDGFGGDTGFASRDMSFVPPGNDTFSLFGRDKSFSSPASFSQPPKDPSLPDTTYDYIPLRDDYIPLPPRPSGIKREREPETDEEEPSSSESDDDSVIFEDGSVGESVNLSLRGSDRGKGEVEVVRIVGEQDTI